MQFWYSYDILWPANLLLRETNITLFFFQSNKPIIIMLRVTCLWPGLFTYRRLYGTCRPVCISVTIKRLCHGSVV